MQYDLTVDEQKVEFAKAAAELISSYTTPVEREIYATRAAEMAGLTTDVMKLEVAKAFKKRTAKQKKAQERQDMEIAAMRQPKSREIRYDNLRSAVAEEDILRMVLREPALFDRAAGLTGAELSVPMFGRAFDALLDRWRRDLSVTPGALSDVLSPAEMAHLTSVLQKPDAPVSEQAMDDCLRIVREERAKRNTVDAASLLRMQEELRRKKGYGGT